MNIEQLTQYLQENPGYILPIVFAVAIILAPISGIIQRCKSK